jgi:cystathionine gamma-synthase
MEPKDRTVRGPALLAALRQAREFAGATPGTLETFLAVRGARTLGVRLERAAERHGPHGALSRSSGGADHALPWIDESSDPPSGAPRAEKALGRSSRSMSAETPRPPTQSAPGCSSFNMPRAWARWSRPSSAEPASGQEHLPPSLLWLSVGIEVVEDLWADLDGALRIAAISRASQRG